MEDCCKDENNLEIIEKKILATDDKGMSSIKIVRKCKICGRNHYEFDVTPVEVGVNISGLG